MAGGKNTGNEASFGIAAAIGSLESVNTAMTASMLSELHTLNLVSTADVTGRTSAAPKVAGLYAWWFADDALDISMRGTVARDGMRLCYIGIAPRRPSASGRLSRSNLRVRLRQHCRGPVASSTLRRSLVSLLQANLGLTCIRSASGKLILEGEGEQVLSGWLAEHAQVSWLEHPEPWTLETALLQGESSLPLNIQGRAASSSSLTALRSGLG